MAVILGSGLLLDIPLADLSRTFREVVLVDVVHPHSVFCRAKWYRNVRLVRADAEVDFVASVNLLSQLPHLPTAYLDKNAPRPERETDAFARQLIESHLDYLQRLPGVVSLITDVEKQQVDRNGKVIQQFDLLYDVRPPRHDDDWLWAHVPINHLSPEWAYQRRVIAVRNVKSRVH